MKGRYESADLHFTLQYLTHAGLVSGTALDVGANIGNHSLYFARHFSDVVALEPNPRVFELLCFNTKLQANIEPLMIGASDRRAEMRLSFDLNQWGCGHLARAGELPTGGHDVPVTVIPLDELGEVASRRIGLIKIDVEGHELHVLKGASQILARSQPVILFEQHGAGVSNESSDVISWLRAHGYDRFLEVRSFPSLPRGWVFPGRRMLNGLLRLIVGERKKVVPILRFERAFYPMVIALPPVSEIGRGASDSQPY